jgi:hypothetical protein
MFAGPFLAWTLLRPISRRRARYQQSSPVCTPRRRIPTPVFLKVRILKNFKSNVLKLRIPKGLLALFRKCGF